MPVLPSNSALGLSASATDAYPRKRGAGLFHDERGGILVIGVVMGALLVGGLWHIASVGDAIIWRETAQDAADAAAFENAVWNARGMNLLAMMNMLMALVMAVLVIWRTLILFVTSVIAIIGIACGVGLLIPNPISVVACTLTPALPSVTSFLARIRQTDERIADNVVRITRAIGSAQKVVAGAIPVLGVAASVDDTNDAFIVDAVVPYSVSLLPSLEGKVGKKYSCDAGEEPATTSPRDWVQSRVGYGVSLPAQEDRWALLCQRAGELVPNNIAGILERAGAPLAFVSVFDALSSVAGAVIGSFPTAFCAKTGIPQAAQDILDNVALDHCREESKGTFVAGSGGTEKKWRKPDPDNPGDYLEGQYVDSFDLDACKKAQAQKAAKAMGDVGAVGSKSSICSRPVKVWDYAANGNLALQSFSLIYKEPAMLGRDDKGLDVADGARAGSVQEVDVPWIRAQAETYYDCAGPWEGCRSDALWTLNWRARLRRIQRFEDMAARMAERLAVETLINGVYKVVGRFTKRAASGRGAPDILAENTRDTWATDQIRRQVRAGAYWSVGGRLVLSPPSGPTVLH